MSGRKVGPFIECRCIVFACLGRPYKCLTCGSADAVVRLDNPKRGAQGGFCEPCADKAISSSRGWTLPERSKGGK